MFETFVAVGIIAVLAVALWLAWRGLGYSAAAFYVFIVYCAVDMIMLLTMGYFIQKPLAVWQVAIGFFFPPPFAFVFLLF